MKRCYCFFFIIFTCLSVSCRKDNEWRDEPVVPQGEATREFLSQIRVGKDGDFQYWNQDSPALKELKAFVATVTDPGCKGYVPPQDRVAAFDVDGTLMCETAPFYFNWMLFFHRYLHDDSFTPEDENDRVWAKEAEEYVLANRKSPEGSGLKQQKLQAIGFRGMTDVEFSKYVSDFINNEYVTGLSNLKWGAALYWPMIEVVSYLVANDFVVFLCSGVDRDVCRVIAKDIYDIPKYHMIASDVNYVLEHQGEWVEMINSENYNYLPGEEVWRGDFMQLSTAVNKIIKMRRELGQKPILSWGNSGGDYPMFHYTNNENIYPHISFCLLCDDTERELGNEDKAEKCKTDCLQNGWIPVSMKSEWWTIYGPQVVRN